MLYDTHLSHDRLARPLGALSVLHGQLYDFYTLVDTLGSCSASDAEKTAALGGFALSVIALGGGYGTAGKAVANNAKGVGKRKYLDAIENADGSHTVWKTNNIR